MNGIVLISAVGWGVCISNEFLSWLSACVIALVPNWKGCLCLTGRGILYR